MYPARFDYLKVDSFASASAALLSGGAGAKALAGGQTLIPMLKLRLLKPELIIDLGGIAGADDITVNEQAIEIGALARGPGSQGVAITDVDPNGLAAEKGLAPGDIILEVSNNPVHTPADVHNAISRAQASGKRDIVMRVRTRNDRILFVALAVPPERPTLWGRIQSWIHSL